MSVAAEPAVTNIEVPEWRKPPPGDKLMGYFATAGAAAGGIAFAKPLANLAPQLAIPVMLVATAMLALRPRIFKGRDARHGYDTVWQFLFLLGFALIIVWIGDSIVPADKQLGGVATLVPGVSTVQANLLPVTPAVKSALLLEGKVSDAGPAASLQTVAEALSSSDPLQRGAAEAIIRNSSNPNTAAWPRDSNARKVRRLYRDHSGSRCT